jgi:group II intron reverse transcriptase/maturase
MIDMELLRLAWRKLNKRAASGVDKVSAREYERNLDENLDNLIDRLKEKRYRAKLVKRRYIPKPNGKKRPLGIPAVEDKLLQKAVAMILEAIYEQDFLESSYGYRPGRNGNGAVRSLQKALNFDGYEYVVESDIKSFFDNLNHKTLVEMLKVRIDDKNLIRLIQKWLKAGILEPDGKVVNPLTGTPQGGVISSLMANVYLHYVLDVWVETEARPYSREGLKYVRYADD